MEEQGEIVCSVGSSLSPENVYPFSNSSIAISVDPLHPKKCLNHPFANHLVAGTPHLNAPTQN
eukprot:Pgem_evm1s3789